MLVYYQGFDIWQVGKFFFILIRIFAKNTRSEGEIPGYGLRATGYEFKFQIPSTKHQTNSKIQIPSTKQNPKLKIKIQNQILITT
jgi:hypothetical protein